jgi:hypothetical protein
MRLLLEVQQQLLLGLVWLLFGARSPSPEYMGGDGDRLGAVTGASWEHCSALWGRRSQALHRQGDQLGTWKDLWGDVRASSGGWRVCLMKDLGAAATPVTWGWRVAGNFL